MKKIIFLYLILCTAISSAQSTNNNATFKAGEWFKFRIHYGIFNASYATLEVKDDIVGGKPVFHVVGKGKTTGLARLFFNVDDDYESYFDKVDGKPYKFIRKIDEGGYTKDIEIHFDHGTNKAKVIDHKHKKDTVMDVPVGVQDLISAFYYLRNNYDTQNLQLGDEVVLNMLYGDDEVFNFKLKYLGKETVKTKFGKIRCLMFRPYVRSGRVFKEKESLTLWVSDDANKIPIRIKADLAVGSLKADLDEFKGLKYQFKIVAD
ncbi:DUF3108 domain-containing protein [Zhouia sp. PK063]|uniref:DUF3108 domain-containing protein n=1 Tax=Zhouia sp. PK063 TaxID=3373602 RepID=UPI0037966DA5